MKTITELSQKIGEEVSELNEMIEKRMKELYEISKKKGINDFGWKDNVPYEDDYETEEAYQSAWDDFCENAFNLIRYGWDYASNTREFPYCYRFKFNDRGSLVIAAYYDETEDGPHTDCDIVISVNDGYNYRQLVGIIRIIEKDLGIEFTLNNKEMTWVEEFFDKYADKVYVNAWEEDCPEDPEETDYFFKITFNDGEIQYNDKTLMTIKDYIERWDHYRKIDCLSWLVYYLFQSIGEAEPEEYEDMLNCSTALNLTMYDKDTNELIEESEVSVNWSW